MHDPLTFDLFTGYYCPMNSSIPTVCPIGTYNAFEYGESEAEDCSPCPVDHFNHLEGQGACFHCGAEAYQPDTGQEICICNGAGKQFQVCQPLGFTMENNESQLIGA